MKRFRSQFSIAVLAALMLGLAPPAHVQSKAAPHSVPEQTTEVESPMEITRANVDAAIAELETLAQAAIDDGSVPGLAIAVVYGDEVLYLKGFGVREAGGSDPVTEDTVFQLASMSKPLAATIVAALVSDGVVGWDDRVIEHNPEFQMYDPWVTQEVTIRDLFNHRSGLPGSAGNDIEGIGYDRDEILHRLRFVPPASSFRSAYAYSNFGVTAGAVAAARAAGMAWEEAAATELYAPLGMASTSSRYADYAAAPNRALLHTNLNGDWEAQFTRQPDAQSPGGGASSTARDMAQWLRLLLNEGMLDGQQVISATALAEMHQPLIHRGSDPVTGGPSFYGLGWNVGYDDEGHKFVGHAGAFSTGARTYVQLLPAEKLGIVVLANAFPTGVPDGLAASFFDLALHGNLARDWIGIWNAIYQGLADSFSAAGAQYATPPAEPSPALALDAYAGTYTNDYVGDIEIAEQEGGLVLRVGPDQVTFPLQHWNRDTFLYAPDAELPTVFSSVRFTIGADGAADGVAISTYADNGAAEFGRVP